MQIAQGMELAVQSVRTFQGGGEASAATSGEVLKFTGAKPGSSKQQMLLCTRGGKPSHHPLKYKFKDAKCTAVKWDIRNLRV